KEFGDLISIQVNSEILETCSVKCSNLISVIRQIESEFEFVVLVDGDTLPGGNWLEAMIRPFDNPEIKVTTGIRWFDVTGSRFGTWVRYIWNTAAIVQMVCYRIPWGGSLAIRTSFIRDAEVLDEWSRGLCEDTMLGKLCRRTGGKIEVVPEAIMPSEEEISIKDCVPWISRQLLTARLHHPRWPLVLFHGIATATLTFGAFILMMASLFAGSFSAAIWFASGYLALQLGNVLLLNWIESPVREIRDSEVTFFRNPLIYLLSIVLTQVCYVTAVFRAVFVSRLNWRKVCYRIHGKRVELTEFAPYVQGSSETESL
ncbi:MAG: glycosyltransferase family 2 protein, partial [Planctomycetota bacterium]|nr:glycosyltransferase family 2 protein [Planctomycetota bacterium]